MIRRRKSQSNSIRFDNFSFTSIYVSRILSFFVVAYSLSYDIVKGDGGTGRKETQRERESERETAKEHLSIDFFFFFFFTHFQICQYKSLVLSSWTNDVEQRTEERTTEQ